MIQCAASTRDAAAASGRRGRSSSYWWSMKTVRVPARAGLDIAPPVSDHVGFFQGDALFPGSFRQHSWCGLAARAAIPLVMVAHLDLVQGQLPAQEGVHLFDRFPVLFSPRHVGLVGDDDEQEPRGAQILQRLPGPRHDFQLRDRRGREGLPATDDGAVENPVPVQKHGPLRHFEADSHFVCRVFSRGCETIRCQTTAWNDSVCGVTVSALTVGTTTHAAAALAV